MYIKLSIEHSTTCDSRPELNYILSVSKVTFICIHAFTELILKDFSPDTIAVTHLIIVDTCTYSDVLNDYIWKCYKFPWVIFMYDIRLYILYICQIVLHVLGLMFKLNRHIFHIYNDSKMLT